MPIRFFIASSTAHRILYDWPRLYPSSQNYFNLTHIRYEEGYIVFIHQISVFLNPQPSPPNMGEGGTVPKFEVRKV